MWKLFATPSLRQTTGATSGNQRRGGEKKVAPLRAPRLKQVVANSLARLALRKPSIGLRNRRLQVRVLLGVMIARHMTVTRLKSKAGPQQAKTATEVGEQIFAASWPAAVLTIGHTCKRPRVGQPLLAVAAREGEVIDRGIDRHCRRDDHRFVLHLPLIRSKTCLVATVIETRATRSFDT